MKRCHRSCSGRVSAGVVAGALLPMILLAGCGGGGAALFPGPDRAGAALSEEEIGSIAEVLRLEDARTYEAGAFQRLAGHASPEVRRRAITAAGRIGDPAAATLLLRALTADGSAAVRADAAFALGELGDTSAVVIRGLRDAVPLSWAPVRTEDTDITVEIVAALGKLGSRDAGRLVTEALRRTYPATGEHAQRIAAEALLAAWREPRPDVRVTAIAPFLRHPERELRWRAVYALSRMGVAQATPQLLPLLNDGEEHRVRAYAARGLTAPRTDSAGIADSAAVALVRALEDGHPHVRINALGALASYEDAPLQPVAARLRDEDPNTAVAAAAALGRLGDQGVRPLRVAAEDRTLSMAVRGAALSQLAALDPDAALDIAEPWTQGGFPERYLAARALGPLGTVGWPRAEPLFQTLVSDADDRVAIAALEAAGALTAEVAEAAAGDGADASAAAPARAGLRTLLLASATDGDPRRRAVALGALVPVVVPADRTALLDAYAAMAAGPEDTAHRAAAIAAVEALGTLRARDSGVAAAFFDRFQPADRWVHRAVADTLGAGWGDAPAAVAATDEAFFEDIVRRYIAGPLADGQRPRAVIRTGIGAEPGRTGEIVIELRSEEAPLTVANFVDLASDGYYDDGVWHRVVPNFVLQDGAPGGYSVGGPGWAIRDEMNRLRYQRGAVGMALSGPDTGGGQWFITHSPHPHLDGGYTIFGQVVDGMDVADAVTQGDVIHSIQVRW